MRTVLVTGGNSGIGFECVRALARDGTRVIMASRDRPASVAAIERIRRAQPDAAVTEMGLDLGDGNVVTKNSVVGNRGFGIIVPGEGNVVTKNSIFGNDDSGDTTDALPAHLVVNCGLQSAASTLDASRNFWGAEAGPGGNPADAFCQGSSVVSGPVQPVATKEVKVKSKAAK